MKRVFCIFLAFVFALPLAACGNAEEAPIEYNWIELELGGNKETVSIDMEAMEDLLFGKYYVFSKENEEKELFEDFEHRLVNLGIPFYTDRDAKVGSIEDYICERLVEESSAGAEALGISFADYVRQNYSGEPKYSSEYIYDDFNSPEFFVPVARLHHTMWTRVNYIAKVWNIEADADAVAEFISRGLTEERAEYEALKQAIFRYSVENAKIVYRHKSPWFYLLVEKAWESISTNPDFVGYYYVAGEDGYAAVYTSCLGTRGDDLDPYVGERIFGNYFGYGAYRFTDRESWEYLVIRTEYGQYMLATFDHWIAPDSEEYGNYVALYGHEPKIHP
ncbi:MAG: hypothetical protein II350_07490 [Clostridia bacterium]|nr:hypothetical protein [Clostridia bacterium]